ncbi:hypothetical protein D9757_011955 [Collybiopsis confluens]|uniref:Pseudouridine synthase RsuA/RluA-like domain-containing protein n=1 Tax=Collybiopsis confluens TaxID=2823264 RepID=A0A8H5G3N5_9AGAR|nr:hypothetical protein D9757_011955 [Collybiopsis confluens]
MIMSSFGGGVAEQSESVYLETVPGLKKIPPYWYPYTTYAKERWLGRELLEVVSTEFRDRSIEYYRYALESGVTTINGQVAKPDHIIQNGDRMENVVHRHEPPVSSIPIKVLLEDNEREFIVVDKPGSIPVHASGRYHRNTLVAILMSDFGYEKIYTVNRLDRLTSGLMILPTSSNCARRLTNEFVSGTVRKEYVARVNGKFPGDEITCEEPLLTVDRQMGLNIVHPDGKPAKTVFQRLRYDEPTDTSVVLCKPFTGRSHQLRVHLQYLGHPISNDPVYGNPKIWGDEIGKGGIDIIPSDDRSAPAPPAHLAENVYGNGNPESLAGAGAKKKATDAGHTTLTTSPELDTSTTTTAKLLPRETGEDIGMGSPVPLSSEAVGVITRLRNQKDEAEDWSRWRDVIFRAKGKMRAPRDLALKKPPPANQRKKNKGEFVDEGLNEQMKGLCVNSTGKETGTSADVGSGDVETSGLMVESSAEEERGSLGVNAPDTTKVSVLSQFTSEVSTPLEGVEATPLVENASESPSPLPFASENPSTSVVQRRPPTAPNLPPPSKRREPIPLVRIPDPSEPIQLTTSEALSLVHDILTQSSSSAASASSPDIDPNTGPDQFPSGPAAPVNQDGNQEKQRYCPECYLPLHPDPDPEMLYIFLHALRYTTSLGMFETEMPHWSREGFLWKKGFLNGG